MGRYREYSLFMAHNALSILTFVGTLFLSRRPVPYFLTYWIGEAASTVLALLVILAIFKPAAEVLYIERPRLSYLLPIGIALIVVIPIWQAVYRPLRLTLLGHVASGLYSFVLAILCLQALILLACLLLSRSIPWTRYDFAIISGFGISALMKWIAYVVRWNYGSRFEDWFTVLLPGATAGAVLVWLIAFLRPEPPTTKTEPDATDLQRVIDLMHEHTEFVTQILKDPRLRRRAVPDQPR